MNNILEELEKIAGKKNVLTKEPMKKHTTFRTGGEADYFVTVQEENVLAELRTYLEKNKIPYYVIGNGSNLLFPDEGYAGVIIQIGRFPDDIRISDTAVTAGAGVKLSQLANRAYQAGLTGMEFAAGIPGTVGGAVVMNAGAYGGEMKDILVQAKVMDAQGNIFRLSRDELDLSYRHSIIPEKALIVLEADFLLQHGNPEEIKAVMNALAAKRREKQPGMYFGKQQRDRVTGYLLPRQFWKSPAQPVWNNRSAGGRAGSGTSGAEEHHSEEDREILSGNFC